MIDSIKKYQKSTKSNLKFSLLIPSWNNLDYLKLCIQSIQKNSFYEHQIIVIVNEGTDGTTSWIDRQSDIDYVFSKENIGICYALNISRSLVKTDYVVYINDDMYVLPNWDLELDKEISKIGTKNFMLSSTMIEPHDTGNNCVVVKDFGADIGSFNEGLLLEKGSKLHKSDWRGSNWPPNIMHIDIWDLIGGYSIEFSPGMSSDHDLTRKLYEVGVRYFKGVGTSLVYHFGSKSIHRIKKNKGRMTFLRKWETTIRQFNQKYLKRGEPFIENIEQPKFFFIENLVTKIKIILSYLKV
ncbi:MAG: glycosyltransferase [Bacteroidetes bacterium]|nr:MAG: glycosyltransferase [Bacteroidota bacterium]